MAQTRKKSYKKRAVILAVLLLLFVFCVVFVVIDQFHLTVVHYTVPTDKLDRSVRIVELTDMHNREFGKDNENLVNMVKAQKPELITMVGDMNADSDDEDQKVIPLITRLSQLAPVYYVMGNHECRLLDQAAFVKKIEEAGAVYIKNNMERIKVGGGDMLIGGICYYPFYESEAPDFDNPQRHFMDDFSEQDGFKLLLCHFPEYFIWRLSEYDIDLMLAGHTHGGAVRLPFLGGIFAPNQDGLFPEYCDGYHTKNGSSIIISKGLGSNKWWIPRINNPPEITVVDIVPEA